MKKKMHLEMPFFDLFDMVVHLYTAWLCILFCILFCIFWGHKKDAKKMRFCIFLHLLAPSQGPQKDATLGRNRPKDASFWQIASLVASFSIFSDRPKRCKKDVQVSRDQLDSSFLYVLSSFYDYLQISLFFLLPSRLSVLGFGLWVYGLWFRV